MPAKKKKIIKAQKTRERRKRFLSQYSDVAKKTRINLTYKKIAQLDIEKKKGISFKKTFENFLEKNKKNKINYIKRKYSVDEKQSKKIFQSAVKKNQSYKKIIEKLKPKKLKPEIFEPEIEPEIESEAEEFSPLPLKRILSYASLDTILKEGNLFKLKGANEINFEVGNYKWTGNYSDYITERLIIKANLEEQISELESFREYPDAWKIENIFEIGLDDFEGSVFEVNTSFREDIDDYIPVWTKKE